MGKLMAKELITCKIIKRRKIIVCMIDGHLVYLDRALQRRKGSAWFNVGSQMCSG
jgi:hypothetical protein